MRTPVAVPLTYIGLVIAAAAPRLVSGQAPPPRSSEPRLVVPASQAPAQTAGQPTGAPAAAPVAAQPETTVTAVTAAPGNVTRVGTPPPATSSSAQAATMGNRSYTAGRFALMIEGASAGYVKSLEGGTAVGDVVTESGPTVPLKKHIANVKYEDISAVVGIGAKPVLDWIAQSWKGFAPKSGSIITMNFDYKAQSELQFSNALITETTIPTLDGSSKEAGYFTVKIAPEQIRQSKGSGATVDNVGPKQKAWLTSNFRFEMAGLDGSRVAKIESFTVRNVVAPDAVGAYREPTKTPGKIEFPNLKISLGEGSAQGWGQWFDDFVMKGNNGDAQERNGAIVFLGPDMKNELARINLFNCGIFRLAADTNSEKLKRITADLYCERMDFVPPAS